jgi:hypothetical protein
MPVNNKVVVRCIWKAVHNRGYLTPRSGCTARDRTWQRAAGIQVSETARLAEYAQPGEQGVEYVKSYR